MNCVNTNMRLMLELIQLEIGISTRRYLPAMGTAGLLRLAVKGYKREPAPPPNMMDNVLLEILKPGIKKYLGEMIKVTGIKLCIVEYFFPN